jgi:hypothetical protein
MTWFLSVWPHLPLGDPSLATSIPSLAQTQSLCISGSFCLINVSLLLSFPLGLISKAKSSRRPLWLPTWHLSHPCLSLWHCLVLSSSEY